MLKFHIEWIGHQQPINSASKSSNKTATVGLFAIEMFSAIKSYFSDVSGEMPVNGRNDFEPQRWFITHINNSAIILYPT